MRNISDKINIFKKIFIGRIDIYGTYAPHSGKSWQVKQQVTDNVIYNHITGKQPFGLYPLVENIIQVLVIDFDHEPLMTAVACVSRFREMGFECYIEISKSKGFHVWLFFCEFVKAYHARLLASKVLIDIGKDGAEVFPKQDSLHGGRCFGNFINLPLYGDAVRYGKTLFIDNHGNPYSDQWAFLRRIKAYNCSYLESKVKRYEISVQPSKPQANNRNGGYILVPCMKTALEDGVDSFQRVICFRLAVRFRQLGFPADITIAALEQWSLKNNPIDGKRVITRAEIVNQVNSAYKSKGASFGCGDPAVSRYCDKKCPIYKFRRCENGK